MANARRMLEKTANYAFTCFTKKTKNKTDDYDEKGTEKKEKESDQKYIKL